MSSDGGALLLRDAERLDHTVEQLLAQRVDGLALGDEDLNDHDALRADPLHGQQEGRFLHGYYGHYCYLPWYVCCGDHLRCCRLRTSNQDTSAGALDEVERIVGQLRLRWPDRRVTLRADSGCCREANQVDYCFGLARNARLEEMLAGAPPAVRQQHEATGEPARQFGGLRYRTHGTWPKEPTRAAPSPPCRRRRGRRSGSTSGCTARGARGRTE